MFDLVPSCFAFGINLTLGDLILAVLVACLPFILLLLLTLLHVICPHSGQRLVKDATSRELPFSLVGVCCVIGLAIVGLVLYLPDFQIFSRDVYQDYFVDSLSSVLLVLGIPFLGSYLQYKYLLWKGAIARMQDGSFALAFCVPLLAGWSFTYYGTPLAIVGYLLSAVVVTPLVGWWKEKDKAEGRID